MQGFFALLKNNKSFFLPDYSKKSGNFALTTPIQMNIGRQKIRYGLLFILCWFSMINATASKKIYVLADIHVMGPSLVDTPENTAWQEDLEGMKIMQELSVPIFDKLVETIKAAKPDALFIVGDLTKASEVESHHYVVNKLTEIRAVGIPIYVIPGNRDRGYLEDARKYENNTYTDAEMIDNDTFAELYKDYGYGEGSERYEETLTYIAEPFAGLTLIGLDDGIWASPKDDVIDWVCKKAKAAQERGNQVLMMTHHMIMPHYYNQNEIFELSTQDNYQEIRQKLMDAGIKVVLTGHTHVSDIARYTDEEGREIYDVATGSPISYPCDYRILTIDEPFTRLDIETASITELEGHDNFTAEAKFRLEESGTLWAEKWLAKRFGEGMVSVMLAPEVSYCFLIYAEGNEPQNPETPYELNLFKVAQEDIAPRLGEDFVNVLDVMAKTFKSMIGDYQTEEDSTNIVDDRTLSIEMPKLPTGIISFTQEPSIEQDQWYTLQGLRLARRPSKAGIYLKNGKKTVLK